MNLLRQSQNNSVDLGRRDFGRVQPGDRLLLREQKERVDYDCQSGTESPWKRNAEAYGPVTFRRLNE